MAVTSVESMILTKYLQTSLLPRFVDDIHKIITKFMPQQNDLDIAVSATLVAFAINYVQQYRDDMQPSKLIEVTRLFNLAIEHPELITTIDNNEQL